MPEISLKCRNCPRLKANKTNDLVNDHTVTDSKTNVIQMLARAVVDNRRRASQLAGILRDLCLPMITFPGGIRPGERRKSRRIVVT